MHGGGGIAPSYAVNLIGNLPSNDASSTILSSTSGTNIKAVSFTLPTGTDYILNNVILRLGNYDSSDVFRVQIRNDGVANPGSTVLANFNLPGGAQGATNSDYTFNPATAFTFEQSTRYWLYVDISSVSGGLGSIIWRSSLPTATPTGVATFGAYRFSNTSGTSFANSSLFNSFEINATPVPFESDALPLVASGVLFGFGLWTKKKLAQKKIDSLKH